ncbi:3-deoxy-7-phosphoheptulonate synthase [Pseudobdellovibrio exovorus]|uniref:3-deoxy-7-phosphoheptulonate synthase n=1 Tax=Pseudobdellovibrio exovorus JSS TaxID=1184267 RepID=M4V5R4_9BACT|nr:3-deoxy-7-phosphoheptulonate synthase [Pseudobdellovibrio exovorus]AGH94702.1 3-deoxy-7-phosphoheptulonate synthase [Pseudobdellovibrio exovorus JSS]
MTVQIGEIQIGGPRFTVIAGPCSIESENQFLSTANAVKDSGASILRGGIWKMRTSQKSFQGLGSDSFEFIQKIKAQVGLPLISEVTDIRQIEEVSHLVDAFQVGARNMHNYALLKELGSQPKPVLLKRSFSAFIDEWLKAADYVLAGAKAQVILCERGIRTFETATRNTLDLNAVVYAKKHTGLPVIVDPSHAVGIADLVPQLCYASAAAGADGLIVEVHPNPVEALSDADQALNFETFDKMMKQLEKVLNAFDRGLNKA